MSESNTTNQLPSGWARTDIGTLGNYINGRGFGKNEWRVAGLPIIRIQNLNDESASFNYSNQDHEEKYKVKDGDLLVAWAASLGVFKWNRGPAWLNQHIFRVEPEKRLVRKEFLFYALQGAIEGLYRKAHGSGMVHVTRGKFDSYPINLPPLKEQKRIVSKIDELFSEVEEGERALEKVQTLVERYRQSVLKAAVTGELTRDWREKHKDQLESGKALLARILKARREAWETAEFAKVKAKGQKPANDTWKAKYKEPVAPNTYDLPELPSGWHWLSLDQLSWDSNYGTSQKCGYDGEGIAVLRIPNVRSEGFSFEDVKFAYDDSVSEVGDSLTVGDLLVIRTNGSENIVGMGAVLLSPIPIDCYFASYLIRFRLCVSKTLAAWINHCWDSRIVRSFVEEHRASSAGQYNISQSSLRELAIPIPPESEANAILDIISERSASREHAAATVNQLSGGISRLRQSILRCAFTGKLVPQDPTDEPASALLERIAAERAVISNSKKKPATKSPRKKKAKA